MAAGGIGPAVAMARRLYPDLKIEVEVEGLEETREALAARADILLLDNFSLDQLREAAGLAEGTASSLEASGDVTLETLPEVPPTATRNWWQRRCACSPRTSALGTS